MIPTERLRELAASPIADESLLAAELLAARESMSLPGYQRIVDERDAARAEAKKYHDALVARHGGEPIALLSELDAARAVAEQARRDGQEIAAGLHENLAEVRAEVERLRGIKPELPGRPGIWEGSTAVRFGIRWNGPQSPLAVPMDDGYWTPWHLAQAEVERLKDALCVCKEAVEKQRDDLLAAAEPVADALRDIAGSGHGVYLDAYQAAVEAMAAEQPKPAGGA